MSTSSPRKLPSWLWLIAPYLALLVVFLALPLANVLVLSFHRYSPVTIWESTLTVENYGQIFTPYLSTITLRTFRIGLITTALCVALGYPVAYYLARCSKRAMTIGMFIILLPLMVSAVVGSFGWIVILGRSGLANNALAALGLSARIDILYSESAVVLALVHFLLPLMVLPLTASIEKISVRMEEAATVLGAGPATMFRLVIVPLSRAGLISGVLLCFSIAISVVVISALLGGRRGRLIGNEIYDQVITAANWPFASSLAIVLVLSIIIAMSLALTLGRRKVA
jgi:ABC-type spermidine/putrescine transport system permease subunit I